MSELYLKKFSARTDRGELQEIFGFSNVERVTVFDVKAIDMEDDAGEMIIESLTGKIQVNLEDGEKVTGTITGKFNGEFLEIDAQFNQNFDEEDMVVEMLNAENFEFIGALQGAHPSMESVTKPSDIEKLLSNSESLMDGEKNISKNINVTITVEGNTCTPSCQFFADEDLPGPRCSLFDDELELTNDAEDILRCNKCLKTFGKDGDLKASVKTNKGSLLSKSEYDPEEDMEFDDEDDDSEQLEWEAGELESEARGLIVHAAQEILMNNEDAFFQYVQDWIEAKTDEGYSRDELDSEIGSEYIASVLHDLMLTLDEFAQES